MIDQIKTTAIGASGVVGVEAVDAVTSIIPPATGSVIELVIQVIIGFATVLGLFRKKKTGVKSKTNKNN